MNLIAIKVVIKNDEYNIKRLFLVANKINQKLKKITY